MSEAAASRSQAPRREAGLPHLHRVGDVGHGGMECGGAPQHRRDQPAQLDDVAGLVATGNGHDRVRDVRQQQRDQCQQDEVEGDTATTGDEDEANEHGEQEDVDDGVGERGHDLGDRGERIGRPAGA